MEEAEIWSALRNHDADALSFFFKKYYSLLFNYGLKISRNEQLIEDAIQDTFFKFWRKKESLAGATNPKAYILKSFRNMLLDRVGSDKKKDRIDPFAFIHETESIQDRIMENEEASELRKKMDQSLDRLPPRQREIIYLKFYRNMEYQEIADVLGINYQSVRNSVHASIKVLRQSLLSVVLFLANSLF
ncbi:MAG: RNA polymerase sigma factor (sigma-70 family) [Cyclobacteriaceae bacterium]|jgi:RNA polymerase sigma factor (sigma-70 family)